TSSSTAVTICPPTTARVRTNVPRCRTAYAAATVTSVPSGPPRYSHHCGGSATPSSPPTAATTAHTSEMPTRPPVTDVSVATTGSPESWVTRPLPACCPHRTAPPTNSARPATTAAHPVSAPAPPSTAIPSPATAATPAAARRAVSRSGAGSPTPRASSASPATVWPATEHTVATATPTSGTPAAMATTTGTLHSPTANHHQDADARRTRTVARVRRSATTTRTVASSVPTWESHAATTGPVPAVARSPLSRPLSESTAPLPAASSPATVACCA